MVVPILPPGVVQEDRTCPPWIVQEDRTCPPGSCKRVVLTPVVVHEGHTDPPEPRVPPRSLLDPAQKFVL